MRVGPLLITVFFFGVINADQGYASEISTEVTAREAKVASLGAEVAELEAEFMQSYRDYQKLVLRHRAFWRSVNELQEFYRKHFEPLIEQAARDGKKRSFDMLRNKLKLFLTNAPEEASRMRSTPKVPEAWYQEPERINRQFEELELQMNRLYEGIQELKERAQSSQRETAKAKKSLKETSQSLRNELKRFQKHLTATKQGAPHCTAAIITVTLEQVR
ncbi:MAG: hypothetical protein EA369_04790 [Bradymonadales bacterium]|nr:MAG: hypothetical protein EA369_04790 [Bradymonadales bacterium]